MSSLTVAAKKTTIGVGSAMPVETSFGYDVDTLALESVTDNAGKVTSFTNDASGNRLSVEDPSGRISRWTFNGFDQALTAAVGEVRTGPSTTSTAEVVTTQMTYSAEGLPLTATEAAGTAEAAATEFVYGDAAHPEDLTKVIDPGTHEWMTSYDADTGDVVSTTNPLGETTETEVNEIGWPLRVTAPKGVATAGDPNDYVTTFDYDLANRIATVTGPEGDVSRTVLDAGGKTISSASGITAANPTGDVTTYGYDAADQLETVDPPGPGSRSYLYGLAGELKRFTNENGAWWDYGYDAVGRLESTTDPVGNVTANGYDTAGRLAWVLQPVDGATCSGTKVGCVSYSYDDAGRPTDIDYSDPDTPDVTGITYDALGRRTAASTNGPSKPGPGTPAPGSSRTPTRTAAARATATTLHPTSPRSPTRVKARL